MLFKMLFVKYPDLLKRLVARILNIPVEGISMFEITNPEMLPSSVGDKFCRLDINMTVDGERVNLEVQVKNRGDYPERSLYYWARMYSGTLPAGGDYSALPRTVQINIVGFRLFRGVKGFHSEFRPLEVTRHTALTDKMALHYIELPKLPKITEMGGGDAVELWLAAINARTEEQLSTIKTMGGAVMEQLVDAYHDVAASGEFKEMRRLWERARLDEASALAHAERKGELKGERSERLKMAIRMKEDGVSIDVIIKYTGLTIDEIIKL
jgi:predicted transposase/invertase (TIGR01784 family)